MRDGWAESFDPCSPYAYEARRWQRYEHEPPLVTRSVLGIACASFVLLAVVATDVGVATAVPVKVTVTQVNWFVGNISIGNGSGFTVQGGRDVALGLVCEIFCPKFVGANVSSPFTLVNATFAYPWNEYANVTVRAPPSDYTGSLSIVLAWARL